MSFAIPSLPVNRPNRPRNAKPNPNQIYSKPLPFTTFPLPTLIPHNPFSILHLAVVFLSHYFNPPSSQPQPKLCGYYSQNTRSVHITDPIAIRFLWESGFFGKGSLSRSEPTWLDREMKRVGLKTTDASENVTAARRAERRRFKQERARKEQAAIDEKLMEELLVDQIASAQQCGDRKAGKPTLRSKYEGLAEAVLLSPTKQTFIGPTSVGSVPSSLSPNSDNRRGNTVTARSDVIDGAAISPTQNPLEKPSHPPVEDKEHLQLTSEESFYLSFALGVLDIYPESSTPNSHIDIHNPSTPISNPALFSLFTADSTFLPSPLTSNMNPSSPFLLDYVTYHHFRSLGWVVRPGLKFGVTWLLYLRGPVFAHAEFAVVIRPAYTHPFWRENALRQKQHQQQLLGSTENVDSFHNISTSSDGLDNAELDIQSEEKQKDWHWLHSIQRVQAQVRKTLIIAWVEIPPPFTLSNSTQGPNGSPAVGRDELDIKALLKQYRVREMVFKRWIPNRSRD